MQKTSSDFYLRALIEEGNVLVFIKEILNDRERKLKNIFLNRLKHEHSNMYETWSCL